MFSEAAIDAVLRADDAAATSLFEPTSPAWLTVPHSVVGTSSRRRASVDSNASGVHRPYVTGLDADYETSRRSSTISIDYLTLPPSSRPSLGPRLSVASQWSELIRLADRRESEDSITLPDHHHHDQQLEDANTLTQDQDHRIA